MEGARLLSDVRNVYSFITAAFDMKLENIMLKLILIMKSKSLKDFISVAGFFKKWLCFYNFLLSQKFYFISNSKNFNKNKIYIGRKRI